MVNSWHKPRRSVEKDYKFYDSPKTVFKKITRNVWPYKPSSNVELFQLRDLAYMCLLYAGTFRASELCRYNKIKNGETLFRKPSAKKSQFEIQDDLLKFRDNIVLKRSEPVYDEEGNRVYKAVKRRVPAVDTEGNIMHYEYRPVYKAVETLDKYPSRAEINLPLSGSFSIFTKPVMKYIDLIEEKQELFPFQYRRGYQIVTHCTKSGKLGADGKPELGEMQHYLRDMGIKFYSRLLNRNLQDLKEFTGHERIQNLTKYLGEGELERKLKEVTF